MEISKSGLIRTRLKQINSSSKRGRPLALDQVVKRSKSHDPELCDDKCGQPQRSVPFPAPSKTVPEKVDSANFSTINSSPFRLRSIRISP